MHKIVLILHILNVFYNQKSWNISIKKNNNILKLIKLEFLNSFILLLYVKRTNEKTFKRRYNVAFDV